MKSLRIAESFLVLLFAFIIVSCNQNQNTKDYSDTTTTGKINISVDETFYPFVDGEIDTFHAYYKHAEIVPKYTSETQAIKDLINDSARLIIISRELTVDEKKYFESRKLFPRVTKIATDAVAFLIHPDNNDTILSVEHLQQIFTGEVKKWADLKKESKLGDIQIIFDNKNSGTARYLKENLVGGKEFAKNTFAVDSNPQVIDYVSKHPNAIGVIGVNWISDGEDPATIGFLKNIRVISIPAEEGSKGYGSSYRPYQAWIGAKFYPFTRDVYIISREARSGLGTGFAGFVAGDKGQRIILKAGLMPVTMPVRIQQFSQ